LGWAIFYGSVAVLLGCVTFAAFLALVQVPAEERRLAERFGDDYLQYKAAVPRWFYRRRIRS
jgi:protein-S-isoprenylcysteine O-methyltransferase Ste14